MRRCRSQPILHVRVELAAGWVERIAGMNEPGIGAQTSEQIIERFISFDRFHKRASRLCLRLTCELRELALVGLFEREALRVDAVEILFYLGVVDARIEVGQIPFRQAAKPARCAGFPGRTSCASSFLRHDRFLAEPMLAWDEGRNPRLTNWSLPIQRCARPLRLKGRR
jgi:hypothetical protein